MFAQWKVSDTGITLLKINSESQNNLWNLFKVNDKGTRKMSVISFWCLYWYVWTDFSAVSIVTFEEVNASQLGSIRGIFKPFKRQPHKMVKHTQTIRRQQPTNWLSLFDHFVGLVLKSLRPCQSFMTKFFAKSSIIGILYSPEYALDKFDWWSDMGFGFKHVLAKKTSFLVTQCNFHIS